ncbi:N-6 DNA methylase [Cryptosporangium sp. NPDC048952]|uniref:N-6 DNA methylase n=1 Tax=Cryptosporangium sp. NPDC048952 TaxID=3363961 RepID=UPI00371CEF9E
MFADEPPSPVEAGEASPFPDGMLFALADAFRGALDSVETGDIILTMVWALGDPERRSDLTGAILREDWSAAVEVMTSAWPLDAQPGWTRTLVGSGGREQSLQAALQSAAARLGSVILEAERSGGASGVACLFSSALEWLSDREGKRGGEFSTPRTVVELVVALVAPRPGESLFDPFCKSGTLLAGAADAILVAGQDPPPERIAGQTPDTRTWRLADMNLSARGIRNAVGRRAEDPMRVDLYAGDLFDLVLCNPPFNVRWPADPAWSLPQWRYSVPSGKMTNLTWLQLALAKLEVGGRAAVLLPNNAAVSENSAERRARLDLLDSDFVECLVALPAQLFPGTAIPVTLWVLRRGERARAGEVLFVDASELGHMQGRTRRVLRRQDTDRIVAAYRNWSGDAHRDVVGFTESVAVDRLIEFGGDLSPRAHVRPAGTPTGTRAAALAVDQQVARLQILEERILGLDSEIAGQLARLTWKP